MITKKQEHQTVDPVDEIRRSREEHARKFNYDVDAIIADLKRIEKEQNLKTVSLPAKKVKKTGS